MDSRRRDLVVELRTGDDPLTLISAAGRVHLHQGPVADPDVVLTGPPESVVGILLGRISQAEAVGAGVQVTGRARRLAGLRPRGEEV